MRWWLVGLVAMMAAAPAVAQPPSDADQLFEQGRALVKQGNYADACDRFTRSYALDPASGTALNLGDCHEHLGHLAEAWRRFDGAVRQFEISHDERAKFARSRRDALVPRLGTVIVRLADPSVRVTIAGHDEAGAPELQVFVDPGDVEIRAGDVIRHASVGPGASATIDIAAAVHPTSAPAGPPYVTRLERSRGRLWTAYTLAGIGGVTGIVGITLGLVARGDYDGQFSNGHCTRVATGVTCDPIGYSNAQNAITTANFGTGLGIVSVVALGAGAIVYFTAPRERVVVMPTASSTGAALTVTGSF